MYVEREPDVGSGSRFDRIDQERRLLTGARAELVGGDGREGVEVENEPIHGERSERLIRAPGPNQAESDLLRMMLR